MKKKVWGKPKLIVLFRGKPEEAVLQGCKLGTESTGALNDNRMCFTPISVRCSTVKCEAHTNS